MRPRRSLVTRSRIIGIAMAATAVSTALSPAGAQGLPPHAWLFGSWTGGYFPVGVNINAAQCLASPVAIFTKDLVMRATLTSDTLTQRVIATARATASGADFTFAPAAPPPAASSLDLAPPPQVAGFGCENPNVLHVQRHGENEIVFTGCADFPYPLVRCPAR
jgi:hypothetical protein